MGVKTTSEQVTVEAAVLPSEIEQLPDLTGFLKVASRPGWLRVRLTPERDAAVSREADYGHLNQLRSAVPGDLRQILATVHAQQSQIHGCWQRSKPGPGPRCDLGEAVQRALAEAAGIRAAQTLDQVHRATGVRFARWSFGVVAACALVPAVLSWMLLPSRAQLLQARQTLEQLSGVAQLSRQGGRVELRQCGAGSRLCVRVDRKSPFYGEAPTSWCSRDTEMRRETIVRGAKLADSDPLRWLYARFGADSATCLTLAGVPITALDETKHFKLIGTTGTGKSTAIRALLSAALKRGDRAVIADPDGGYCARFFDAWRGDRVLNPFEARSARWEPLEELEDPADPEHLAGALIASSADATATEWRGYARAFVAALLDRCRVIRGCNSRELWRLIAVAGADELRPLLMGTPAQPFLDPENARMFGSLRSIAVSALRALEFVQWQSGPPFSVRRWLREGRGVLFIPYTARQIAALRTLIATWMGLAIFEALSQEEGHDQHLWLVVDELDALGAIEGLKDALARLRKFGGRCVLGFQALAQLSATYGPAAQTIAENCGNTLILRCSGSEDGGTSHYAARLIGDREVIRRQHSRGRENPGGLFKGGQRRSVQTSEQRMVEPAVLAAQIEQLPDLSGYLKVASSPVWRRVRIRR